MVPSFTKEISEHDKRMLTLLHAWAKLRKYWKTRTFQGEVDFHMLQSCLEQDQLQGRQQKKFYGTPTCDLGINYVKEDSHDMIGAAVQTSIALSFLGSLEHCWDS